MSNRIVDLFLFVQPTIKMDKFIILALYSFSELVFKMSNVIYSPAGLIVFFETQINSFNSLKLFHLNVLTEKKSDMVDHFGEKRLIC